MLMLVVFILASLMLQAQTDLRKSAQASGVERVTSANSNGFVAVGIHQAERVQGESMSGWIGFMPVKREPVTSVEEDHTRQLMASPNPTTRWVDVRDVPMNATITVVSFEGRTVDVPVEVNESTARVNMSLLPNGAYTIIIRTKTKVRYSRIVLQR